MRRIGDLLPEAASALGLEPELRRARAAASWQRIVGERVPAATGASHLVAWREAEGLLIVAASAPIVAQELRLRAAELTEAFARAIGGRNPDRFEVVVRRPPAKGPETSRRPPSVD
jgi:hypothetical protein